MDKDKSAEQSIGDLGEFGLIDHLTSNISLVQDSTVKGIGDDAAVLKFDDRQVVVTTDMLTEGVHFDLVYTPMKHLGYKAVMVNLSDIYAMYAIPTQITVSIAASAKITLPMLEEFYAGIRLACSRHRVDLVGGDTTSSLTGLTISITAIGLLAADHPVLRSGAGIHDLICVSGDLGGSYLGLLLLEREKKIFESETGLQPKLTGYEYVLERYLKPEARKDIIDRLLHHGIIPTSMIDISDGLSSELLHLCKHSGTGCRVYEEKIPVNMVTAHLAEEFQMVPGTAALNGGEDYELLFTVPPSMYEVISKIDDISVIGYMTSDDQGKFFVAESGQEIQLKAGGWNAFRAESER
jgi:thiamine-monophosphate kinase